MRRRRRLRHVVFAIVSATLAAVAAAPDWARAQGLLESLSGSEELFYSLGSIRTTDNSGTRSQTTSSNYGSRTNLRLNYHLLPTLNLNTGGTYEKNISDVSTETDVSRRSEESETTITRIRPYLWLTFTDPIATATVGWDRSDEIVETPPRESSGLTRDTYHGMFHWRPQDFPATQARYTKTLTSDDAGTFDTEQDLYYLKSEYIAGGLNVSYAGTYLTIEDKERGGASTQTTHEGRLQYARTFFDGRVSFWTDNDLRFTEVRADRGAGLVGLDSLLALQLRAVTGLSAIDDTPAADPLAAAPSLIDGDVTTSTGIELGFPPAGGDVRRRNFGIDFGAATAVNTLRVWVDGFGAGTLPAAVVTAFAGEIYTSSDNNVWTLVATVAPAPFGPFDRRFLLRFPTVTTRYIKVVTRPLPAGIVPSITIFVTELQAFIDRTAPGAPGQEQTLRETVRTHNLEVRTILFRTPMLYHRFNVDYQESDLDERTRYTITNGLFLNHPLSRIFSLSANISAEIGRDNDEDRTAVLYYAALGATPLPTLTESLVLSGTRQWTGQTTLQTDSIALYNTAELYRGLDASLNLGAQFSSEDGPFGGTERSEYYVNVGTSIMPHPRLSLTTYYLGRVTTSTTTTGGQSFGTAGAGETTTREGTEHRLDLGVSFTPFRTLTLSAAINAVYQTDQEARVLQNYGLSWAPFPDGNLQFAFFYNESLQPDDTRSRLIQPSVRWYLTSRRRSYVDATYQLTTNRSPTARTEAEFFTTTLNLAF